MNAASGKRMRLSIWPALALLLAAMGTVLYFSPNEQTLGTGIKVVYIHVAAIWVGLTGFGACLCMGIWLLISGKSQWNHWARLAIWSGFAWYFLGFCVSLLAAYINWGGVYWAEPRMAMSMRFLIVVLPVATLSLWLQSPRWIGALLILPPLFLTWSLLSTPLVLHPRNPIHTATSTNIQWTFGGMYLLFLALAFWCVWSLHQRHIQSQQAPTEATS